MTYLKLRVGQYYENEFGAIENIESRSKDGTAYYAKSGNVYRRNGELMIVSGGYGRLVKQIRKADVPTHRGGCIGKVTIIP